MKSGIYRIKSKTSNHFYIGSSFNMKERWNRHRRDLRAGKHHSIILQRAWDKYNEEDFVFEIIEYCEIDKLLEREQFFLDSELPIYNICVTAGSQLGRKSTEEAKQKQRQASIRLGIKPPKETWEKRQKSVIMLNDNQEELDTFVSLSEACRYVGKNHTFASCITRAIKLNTKSYGYYWKFTE